MFDSLCEKECVIRVVHLGVESIPSTVESIPSTVEDAVWPNRSLMKSEKPWTIQTKTLLQTQSLNHAFLFQPSLQQWTNLNRIDTECARISLMHCHNEPDDDPYKSRSLSDCNLNCMQYIFTNALTNMNHLYDFALTGS